MLLTTRRQDWFQVCLISVASAALQTSVAQARTDIEPRISIRETFSDNVRLTNSQKDVGLVTTISPGFRASIDGARVQGSIDYGLDYRIGQFSKVFDKVRHSLAARANSELINDFLYLEGGAVATVLNQDLRGSRSISGDNDNPNVNNVFSGYLAPVVRRRVGDFARFEGGYKFSYTGVEDRNRAFLGTGDALNVARQLGSDSKRHEFFTTFSSGDFFQFIRWNVDAAYEAENIKDLNERFRSRRATFNGEIPLNRYFSVLGSVGYEKISDTTDKIDFTTFDQSAECLERTPGRCTVIDQDGLIWDAGFRLSPSQRTELIVRGGRRYDDTVVNVEGFHQITPKTRLSISYGESLDSLGRLVTQQIGGLTTTFAADERLNTIFIPRFQYLDAATGLPLEGSLSVNSSTFASRVGRVGLQLDRRPWTGTITAYREDRRLLRLTLNPGQTPVDFNTIRNRRDVTYGTALSLERSYRGNNKLFFDLLVESNKFVLSRQRKDSFVAGALGYSHKLGRQIEVLARGSYSRRGSDIAAARQSEAAATIGLTATF
jgi:uncharacterized protein (PEP-CTERM system associated)